MTSDQIKLCTRVSPELRRRVRLHCMQQDITVEDWLESLIVAALEPEGKPTIDDLMDWLRDKQLECLERGEHHSAGMYSNMQDNISDALSEFLPDDQDPDDDDQDPDDGPEAA